MESLFKKSFTVALATFLFDFLFHFFLTRPMESLTYFVIKFLLAFFVATALFNSRIFIEKIQQRKFIILATGLVFSALMSTYYRAWELGEAYVPFGSRAPDIIGISRNNPLLFSGTWWIAHALFFAVGVVIAMRLFQDQKRGA